jgi:predicted RNase H-like HicB family nuclease
MSLRWAIFEIRDAPRLESGKTKRGAARLVSAVETIRHTACDELSWSHYRLLMQVEDPVTCRSLASFGRQVCGARTIGTTWSFPMNIEIECEREDDGRWLAEVPQLPGVLAYGSTRDEAMAKAQVLALRVLAERLEHGESQPQSISISVAAA